MSEWSTKIVPTRESDLEDQWPVGSEKLMQQYAALMNERFERMLEGALRGSKDTWVSCALAPEDMAYRVKAPGELITVAHPNFWKKVRRQAGSQGLVMRLQIPFDLDDPEANTAERARILAQVETVLARPITAP